MERRTGGVRRALGSVSTWVAPGVLFAACSSDGQVEPAAPGTLTDVTTPMEGASANGTAGAGTPAESQPPALPPVMFEPECASTVEFHGLGVIPDNYDQHWNVLDARSRYAYWSREWSGNDVRSSAYRWTENGGVQILAAETPLGEDEDVDLFFGLVSADGETVLGRRYTDSGRSDGFRWTQATGTRLLDFEPVALTPDGKTAVGFRSNTPVRWIEGETALEIDPAWSAVQPRLIENLQLTDAGDVVLGASYFVGRSFRWTAATGSVELRPPGSGLTRLQATHLSWNGNVIAGTAGTTLADRTRAVRWTEATGSRDLGDLPGAPPDASVSVLGMSADGSVIVGRVNGLKDFARSFRWTEATGMQDIVPGRNSDVTYVSPNGEVVIGFFWNEVGSAGGSYRWTRETGAVDVGYTTPLGVGADGDLLVGNTLQGPFISTFGALAGKQLPLERLSPGFVPGEWSEPLLEGVSRDGRLLVGEARNPSGQRESWLLYLRNECP